MEQVGVNGVGIHAVVENPPDLCTIGRTPIGVPSTEPLTISVGGLP